MSFLSALKDKYAVSESQPLVEGKKLIEVNEFVNFEFVGFRQAEEHVLKLDKAVHVSLNNYAIQRVDLSDSENPIPNVEELDVSGNELRDWNEVLKLLRYLPKLKLLQLSENQLKENLTNSPPESFSNLKVLVLNRTNVSWTQAVSLSNYFPQLEELHLCYNNLNELQSADDTHLDVEKQLLNLKLLNIEGNQITSWPNVVQSAGSLKSLTSLNLSSNPISSIQEGAVENAFTNLKSLNLSKTSIDNWKSVHQIRAQLKVIEIKLQDLALVSILPSSLVARNLFIACLPDLRKINGSEVLIKERKDSELFYMKMYGTFNADEQAVHEARYKELLQKYPDALTPSSSNAKSSDVIHTIFKCNFEKNGEITTFEKSLPSATTISGLKTIISRTCTVMVAAIKLSHEGFPLDDDAIIIGSFRQLVFVVDAAR